MGGGSTAPNRGAPSQSRLNLEHQPDSENRAYVKFGRRFRHARPVISAEILCVDFFSLEREWLCAR